MNLQNLKPVKDYAEEHGITKDAVYKAIRRGKLKAKKIGSYILVDTSKE
jgi:predicted DNA-binding protein YlxM (UPF0122 family)